MSTTIAEMMDELLKLMEDFRQTMNELDACHELTDTEVLEQSERLDILINAYLAAEREGFRMDDDKKLFKLREREEQLIKKKERIEEDLRKLSKQIKEIQHQQRVKAIEDTIVVLDGQGIHIKDIIREFKQGNFDYLKKQTTVRQTDEDNQEADAAGQGNQPMEDDFSK